LRACDRGEGGFDRGVVMDLACRHRPAYPSRDGQFLQDRTLEWRMSWSANRFPPRIKSGAGFARTCTDRAARFARTSLDAPANERPTTLGFCASTRLPRSLFPGGVARQRERMLGAMLTKSGKR